MDSDSVFRFPLRVILFIFFPIKVFFSYSATIFRCFFGAIHHLVSSNKASTTQSVLLQPPLINGIQDDISLSVDSESELKLISLISRLHEEDADSSMNSVWQSKDALLVDKIITLVVSMDLDAQPKPESKLMSLVTQAISLFHSMDLDSLPEPLSDLISFSSQGISLDELRRGLKQLSGIISEILELEPEPELVSLSRQIVSVVFSMDSRKLLVVSPQGQVTPGEGELITMMPLDWFNTDDDQWSCFFGRKEKIIFAGGGGGGDEVYYLYCNACNGKYHNSYEKVPQEIKHPLHPKHSLCLVFMGKWGSEPIECYCCSEKIKQVFYYCSSACNFAMNIACAQKPPLLSGNLPDWHEHKLALFPSMASLPCNLCALTHSSCPFYVCPPCDFVAHQKCLSLPRTIRICRHPHRISFTKSFDQGEVLSCGVCRRKINNDYGGYSCIKDDCEYAVHSRCATQSNVWDGIDLDGTPDESEDEDVEPFERIADGIIRHFSHKHHHIRLDDSSGKDYDEDRLCQACITPIYFGNFYTCEQCEFILHEKCANMSRKIYHPTHAHPLRLTLVGENVVVANNEDICSVSRKLLTAGFFYKCGKKGCNFKINIPCSLLSEPLSHESHKHPLFLTSKPGESKRCSLCQSSTKETFNCIECEDFSLCFKCATIPIKVRYKHDNHILTLCHGETNRILKYWCEICEGEIMENRFYMCEEYCCVTLHIECFAGKDLYMKPGSSYFGEGGKEISVLPNNHCMSRPVCWICEERCTQRIVFQRYSKINCSMSCLEKGFYRGNPEGLSY